MPREAPRAAVALGEHQPLRDDADTPNVHPAQELLTTSRASAGDQLYEDDTFDRLLEMVGTRGRWNYQVFILCSAVTFVVPLQSLSYQLLGDTPPHWCHVPPLVAANWSAEQVLQVAIPRSEDGSYESCLMYDYNYTAAVMLGYEASARDATQLHHGERKTVECDARYFNATHSTTVTEWDLVCERRALYSTTFSVSHFMRVVSCLTQGLVLDTFGRQRCVVVASALFLLSGFLASVVTSLDLYLVLRGLNAVFEHYFYVGSFVLCLELCTARQRSQMGNLFVVPFSLGFMALPGLALLVPEWRALQATLTAPALPLLAYYWLLPESPRWLATKGRVKEAADLLTQAAATNGRPLPPRAPLLAALHALHTKAEEEARQRSVRWQGSERPKSSAGLGGKCVEVASRCRKLGGLLGRLVSSRRMVLLTFIVFYLWFNNALTYYGMTLYSVNLSTDNHLYMFLGGALELPSYLLLWPLVTHLGRRWTNACLSLTCAAALLLLPLLQSFTPADLLWPRVVLSLVGKIAIAGCYHLSYLMTGELYPTGLRSLAVSLSSAFSSIGAAMSSYVNALMVAAWWGPAVLFGSLSLLAAGLTAVLPETTLTPLPDTLRDAQTLGAHPLPAQRRNNNTAHSHDYCLTMQ